MFVARTRQGGERGRDAGDVRVGDWVEPRRKNKGGMGLGSGRGSTTASLQKGKLQTSAVSCPFLSAMYECAACAPPSAPAPFDRPRLHVYGLSKLHAHRARAKGASNRRSGARGRITSTLPTPARDTTNQGGRNTAERHSFLGRRNENTHKLAQGAWTNSSTRLLV